MCFGETPKASGPSEDRRESLQESDLPTKRSRHTLPCLLFLFVSFLPFASLSAAPQLATDVALSTEGYFVLHWEQPSQDTGIILQQGVDPQFEEVAEEWSVRQTSQVTQSGLTDGIYYFRLLDREGVSNTVSVEVRHHSLGRAALFFALGAGLFSVLLATLIHGTREQKRGDPF